MDADNTKTKGLKKKKWKAHVYFWNFCKGKIFSFVYTFARETIFIYFA